MKIVLKFFALLCFVVVFNSCFKEEDPHQVPIYGKWEVMKYEFSYLDEYYNRVTEDEYPYNEGYYEDYTFKRDNIYYYFYEDEFDMELDEGVFVDYGDFLKLNDIMYSLYVDESNMELETSYQGHTTKIFLKRIK